jgi:hypothetical protein
MLSMKQNKGFKSWIGGYEMEPLTGKSYVTLLFVSILILISGFIAACILFLIK